MEWLIILGAVLAALILGVVYLTACIGRFSFVRRISGENRWRRRAVSFGILAGIFAVLAVSVSVVNAVIIFLHEVLFFLFFGCALWVVRRCTGREFRINWQAVLALVSSV
ncbi:MAG: serine/threonine protein phosphatase, partial [Oscillospiraceae bacterium]|nr:serine/threonine protein phosphatase [Oscillospiraceae bacterium]